MVAGSEELNLEQEADQKTLTKQKMKVKATCPVGRQGSIFMRQLVAKPGSNHYTKCTLGKVIGPEAQR